MPRIQKDETNGESCHTPSCIVQLKEFSALPNDCGVSEGLRIHLEFSLSAALSRARWQFCIIVDICHAKERVNLGETEWMEYSPEEVQIVDFVCPQVRMGLLTTWSTSVSDENRGSGAE